MKSLRNLRCAISGLLYFAVCSHVLAQEAAKIQPVPIKSVQLDDAFWKPRLEVIRTVAIPAALAKCEETGRIANFERAAAVIRGDANADKKLPANPFDDADVFKLIEAASYTLAWHPDAKLDAQLDTIIAKIAAAQEKDGYLYTARTINPAEPHALAGAERWVNEKVDSFELSNLGYLYKAAVAHFNATGKKTLLDVAVRSANLLDTTFGPGKKSIWPGHEGIEAALVSLSEATGDKKYIALAKFMLDERGPAADPAGQGARGRRGGRGNLNQSQQKVVELAAATGNAVDAANLYTGMAEVAANGDTKALGEAADKVWNDVVSRKLYVTGGIGITTNNGAFGRDYLLPNFSAASTTAASAANVAWNQAMFEHSADGKYIDVLERTLYNALLAGLSLDGKRYFDANVLESIGRQQRREWPPAVGGRRGNANTSPITTAASPIDALRTLAALPNMIYATRGNEIFVNLYAAGSAEIKLPGGRTVKIVQETKYPADGTVKFTVSPDQPAHFTLNLRIPDWTNNGDLAGGLYHFADQIDRFASVQFTNGPTTIEPGNRNGYRTVTTTWTPNTVFELNLPMPVRQIQANSQVTEDADRVAIQRGPIVYCADANSPVRAGPPQVLRNTWLTGAIPLKFSDDVVGSPESVWGGLREIIGSLKSIHLIEDDMHVYESPVLYAAPYFTWGNGPAGEMMVWIPTKEELAAPTAVPNLASKARIVASPKISGDRMTAAPNAKDGIESRTSHDNSPLSHFDWWPDRNVTVTCEYTWDAPITIKQTQAYWWDDSTTGGGCKVPASWRALYKKGDEWVPVETKEEYGVAPDKYNKVNFTPVETTALRLEIKIRDDASVGIQEWKVW